MTVESYCPGAAALESHGIVDPGEVFWNLSVGELYEHAVRDAEGSLASNGAIVCTTGQHTGRSPKDKFVVDESTSSSSIWWGSVNQRMSEEHFDGLHKRVIDHYRGRRLYARDMFAGADAATRIPIRVVNETAWHNLFAAQLFIKPNSLGLKAEDPQFTILNAPTCDADPAVDGTNSKTFVAVHFGKRLILIGGTCYAGEIKKSIFTVMNYLLPEAGVLSMHCSANVGSDDAVALFFGLSGTGKTTLSADPERRLIGDDEHGWSDHGVFNVEGGCYAKCIHLSAEAEPQIYNAIRFGTVLENVVIDDHSREIDFDSDELTENTRAAYPLEYIDNAIIPSVAGHPQNVVFLACDAFGVLPPVSRLTPEQAMYHFLSGYTAKVAGTEKGVTEPKATFSACFGAPFLPLPPERYAQMLGERLQKHSAACWLVNTGWSGGGYGVGKRMNLGHTRAMVKAVLDGSLAKAEFTTDPVFGVAIPKACPGVPSEVLTPKNTWPNADEFDAKAKELAGLFADNFRTYGDIDAAIAAAGPRV